MQRIRFAGLEKESVFALRWKKADEHYSTWSYEERKDHADVTAECLRSDFSALMIGSQNRGLVKIFGSFFDGRTIQRVFRRKRESR